MGDLSKVQHVHHMMLKDKLGANLQEVFLFLVPLLCVGHHKELRFLLMKICRSVDNLCRNSFGLLFTGTRSVYIYVDVKSLC